MIFLSFWSEESVSFQSEPKEQSEFFKNGLPSFSVHTATPAHAEPDTTHRRGLSDTPNPLCWVLVPVRILVWSPRNGFEDSKSSQVPFRIMG